MEIQKIAGVAPKAPLSLIVRWESGKETRVDLTGLVARSKHFAVFAKDKTAFRDVRVADYGSGVEWDNGLDLSANTLKIMADEQRTMSGKEFDSMLGTLGLNVEEAARVLDLSVRTIRAYKKARAVPRMAAVTLRRCMEDSNVFAALYRPMPIAPRGRPKSTASR